MSPRLDSAVVPRRLRRIRRPLIALVALVAALAIGYGVKAARSEPPPLPSPQPVVTVPPGR